MQHKYDVIIVGGGPAGLAASISFAQHGLRILLCERKTFPVDKACGEGLMPSGVSHLKILGVLDKIQKNQCHEFVGIRYIASDGTTASARFADGPGLGIRRTELSRALVERAAEFSNIEIRENTKLTHLQREGTLISANLGNEVVTSPILVGADGLRSAVRKWANIPVATTRLRRYGLTQHFAIKPWSEYVEIYWQNGFEAYVTPCGKDQIGVAFLWRKGRADPEYFLDMIPALKSKIQYATKLDSPLAYGPMHQPVQSPVADNVILIGDASGYIDALTGEGISIAFAQAMAAAKIFGSAPKTIHFTQYKKEHQRIMKPYIRTAKMALTIGQYPFLTTRIIQLLSRWPWAFEKLLQIV